MKTEYWNILFSYAGQRSHVNVLAQGILGKWSVPYSARPRKYPNDSFCAAVKRPTLNSIRQTDVDTLMIRTQSRVRVRVIYLNQTGIRRQIESYSFYPELFFSLKIEDTLTFMNISSRNFI